MGAPVDGRMIGAVALTCIVRSKHKLLADSSHHQTPSATRNYLADGFHSSIGADVCPQSSVPHPLDNFTQLGTIGLDNEVDRRAVGGPRLGWPADGHQRSSGSNQARGLLPDVAADEIMTIFSSVMFLFSGNVEALDC
jgi:hypothetical protein